MDTTDQLVIQPTKSIPSCIDSAKPIPHRRTSRVFKEPIWMKDYTILANYLSCKNTTSSYQCSMNSSFSDLVEPQFLSQAARDDRWIQAMKLKTQALKDNNTWEWLICSW